MILKIKETFSVQSYYNVILADLFIVMQDYNFRRLNVKIDTSVAFENENTT